MDLDDIKNRARELSMWAHIATIGADGAPDVTPIHPCWEGDVMWALIGRNSVKARNVAADDRVAMHWQITEKGDGVEVWGTASVHDDVPTKRRLWSGVFDYDLNQFSPGGPDNSPDAAFLRIVPQRAIFLKTYGIGGIERWQAGA
jgi:general stress protein 26